MLPLIIAAVAASMAISTPAPADEVQIAPPAMDRAHIAIPTHEVVSTTADGHQYVVVLAPDAELVNFSITVTEETAAPLTTSDDDEVVTAAPLPLDGAHVAVPTHELVTVADGKVYVHVLPPTAEVVAYSFTTTEEEADPFTVPDDGDQENFNWCPTGDGVVLEQALGTETGGQLSVVAGAKLLRAKLGGPVMVWDEDLSGAEDDADVVTTLRYTAVKDGSHGLATVVGGFCGHGTAAFQLKSVVGS